MQYNDVPGSDEEMELGLGSDTSLASSCGGSDFSDAMSEGERLEEVSSLHADGQDHGAFPSLTCLRCSTSQTSFVHAKSLYLSLRLHEPLNIACELSAGELLCLCVPQRCTRGRRPARPWRPQQRRWQS